MFAPARAPVRVIANLNFAGNQGHNLLGRHLSGPSVQLAGWTGSRSQQLIAKLFRRFPGYRQSNPNVAYHAFIINFLSLRPSVGLVHTIWGDDVIDRLVRPGRCVVTLHQPYELWSEKTWRKIAGCLGVICMAERECVEIRRRCPNVPTAFIPHGIDIDFWHPLDTSPRRVVCAVGRYMRNFPMMVRVAHTLLARHPDVTFRWLVNPDFVVPPDVAKTLPTERFEVVRNLSQEDLHLFYAESWCFFTPYNNVTASNAIVESMASGVPVFTTRVGGMASYGADAMTLTANDDDDAMVEALSRCLDSNALRAELGARARRYAEQNFSWPKVVAAHKEFYSRLLS